MTTKLWVNWGEESILNESQMEAKVNEDYYPDAINEESFMEWLAAEFSNVELWYMDEADKENARRDFLDDAMEKAWASAEDDGWVYKEIETEKSS